MPHLGPLVPDPEAAVHPRRHPRLRRHVRQARLLQAARGVTCRARVTRVQATRLTSVQATRRARDTCLTLSGCEAAGEHQHQDRLLPPPHHVSRVTAGCWCDVSRVTAAGVTCLVSLGRLIIQLIPVCLLWSPPLTLSSQAGMETVLTEPSWKVDTLPWSHKNTAQGNWCTTGKFELFYENMVYI